MSLKKNIRLLTWFNFCTDFRLYGPIAILYFAQVTHSYALGGSIFSIIYITAALFDVPTGVFADRVGRKTTLILGACAAVTYAIFYAIGMNYWFLAVGAVAEGLSRALYSGNNDALLHNLLSEEGVEHEYHVYSGKLSSMFQVALGISGLLGAFLAQWSFPLIMWLSVIPQILCLAIAFQVTDSKKRLSSRHNMWQDLQEGIQTFSQNPRLRLLSLSSILSYGLGETSYEFQAAFYALLLPLWLVGVARTMINIGAAIGFYVSGKVINRFGDRWTLFVGEAYTSVVALFAVIFPSVISPFLYASTSFFFGMGSIAQGSLLQKEFTDHQRATMSSLNSFAGSLFFGVCAFVIGVFADQLGPRNALLILELCCVPILFLLWKLVHLEKKI